VCPLGGPTRTSRTAGCGLGLGLTRTFCRDGYLRLSFSRPFLLCLSSGPFPVLARQGRVFARPLGLSFRFFQALARSPKLILRKTHTLLGHIGLQSCSIDDLRRFCILGGSVVSGGHFAACFFHDLPARRGASLTQAAGACHHALRSRQVDRTAQGVSASAILIDASQMRGNDWDDSASRKLTEQLLELQNAYAGSSPKNCAENNQ
jgi:hypothetical protein